MKQLKLRTETDDLAPFDFLADEGLQLRPNTLSLDPEEGQDMRIVLPLVKATSDEVIYLASESQLKAYRRLIGLYRADPFLTETPWLYLNTATEADKRYFVKEMRLVYPNSSEASPLLRSGIAYVEVQLLVHHAAENEDSVLVLDEVTMSARGSKTTLPAGYGDTLNRINPALIGSTGDVLTDAIASWKFWLGMRREYQGFTNFTPEWDFPDTAGGTDTADATAIGGAYLLHDLDAVPAYSQRIVTYLSDITANRLEWIGTYRLLLRQRLSDANTSVSVQAKTGYQNGSVDIPGPLTSISSGTGGGTNWNLVDLGAISVPPGDYRGSISTTSLPLTTPEDVMGGFKIEIWAELTSGSGELHLDAVYLVPDTNLLIIEGAQLRGGVDEVSIRTFEDDAVQAISNYTLQTPFFGAQIDTSIDHEAKAWGLPPEGGMLVFVGQSTVSGDTSLHNSPTLEQDFRISLSVIERWLGHSEA